jgi:uncharacterized protein
MTAAHYIQTRRPHVFVVLNGTRCLVNHRPVTCDQAVSYVANELRTPKWLGVAFAADETSSAEGTRLKAAFIASGFRVRTGLVKVDRIDRPAATSNNKLQRKRGAASERADGWSRKDKVPSLCGIRAALRWAWELGDMQARFRNDMAKNAAISAILSRWDRLCLPQLWLVAGCLFQTAWNSQAGRPPGAGIKDYDFFYYDPTDLTADSEAQAQSHLESELGDLGVDIEVVNQARVHTWYPEHFGQPYPALRTVEEGIDRFLVLETCVGIRPDRIYSPNGLEGIYAGTLTPNPLTPYPELFHRKVESYRQRWDWLGVQRQVHVAWQQAAAKAQGGFGEQWWGKSER